MERNLSWKQKRKREGITLAANYRCNKNEQQDQDRDPWTTVWSIDPEGPTGKMVKKKKEKKIDFKKSVKRIQESHGFNCLCSKVKDERESLPDTDAHLTWANV